jgi:hypothetical protein
VEEFPGEAGDDACCTDTDGDLEHFRPHDRTADGGVPVQNRRCAAETSCAGGGESSPDGEGVFRTRSFYTEPSSDSKEHPFPHRADGPAAAKNAGDRP